MNKISHILLIIFIYDFCGFSLMLGLDHIAFIAYVLFMLITVISVFFLTLKLTIMLLELPGQIRNYVHPPEE